MKHGVSYHCSHGILLFESETLVQAIYDFANRKVKPDDASIEENRKFAFFYKPNSFFNKILSEVSIPKERRNTLRINNINSISVGIGKAKSFEIVFVFFNDAFRDLSEGVRILAKTEHIGEVNA